MLIGYEFAKLRGYRILWILVSALLIINVIICYVDTEYDPIYFAVEELLTSYEQNSTEIDAYYNDLINIRTIYEENYRLWMHGNIVEEPVLAFPYTYSHEADDFTVLTSLYRTFEANDDYKALLNKQIESARQIKNDLLRTYGDTVKSHYTYQKQEKIDKIYSNILVVISDDTEMGYGWNQIFSFDTINIFLFISVILGASLIITSDFGKSSELIRSTSKGRYFTILAKQETLFIYTVIIVAAFMVTTIVAVNLKCKGLSEVTASLGVFSEYRDIPLKLNILEYLIFCTLCKILSLFFIGELTLCVCMILKGISISVLITMSFVGLQYYLCYSADNDFAKLINIVSCAHVTPLVSQFTCFSLSGKVIQFLPFVCSTIVIACLFLGVINTIIFSITYLGSATKTNRMTKNIFKFRFFNFKFANSKCIFKGSRSLIGYEVSKHLLLKRTIIFLVAAMCIKVFFLEYQYPTYRSYDESVLLTYMETLGGEVTEEKHDFIDREYSELNKTINEYETSKVLYRSGEIEYEEFAKCIDAHNYAINHIGVVERLDNYSDYLKKADSNSDCTLEFLYDTDWIRNFDSGFDIILITILIYLCSGIFADEYKKTSGNDSIMSLLLSTKKGRQSLFRSKIIFAVLFGVLSFFTLSVFDIVHILEYYILPSTDAPLLSISMFQNTDSCITLMQYWIMLFIVRISVCLLFSILVCVIGLLTKSKFITIIISFGVVFTPMLASSFGIEQFEYFDLTNAFSVHELYLMSSRVDFISDYGYLMFFLLGFFMIIVSLIAISNKKYTHQLK